MGSFTARTAPIVMPINTATLALRAPQVTHTGLAYLEAGYCVRMRVSAAEVQADSTTGSDELYAGVDWQ